MIIKITDYDKIDEKKLMAIYAEGNEENAEYFYPQITDKKEAVEKVERDFCGYIKNEFLNGENAYFVLEADGVWVSALRLYYMEENFYYIEALESMPAYRKRGYGAELLIKVIEGLKGKGNFRICDCVSKKNTASIRTHLKCGFKIVSEEGYDYLQNESDGRCFGMEYEYNTNF